MTLQFDFFAPILFSFSFATIPGSARMEDERKNVNKIRFIVEFNLNLFLFTLAKE